MWISLSLKLKGEPVIGRSLYFCEFYLQELDQFLRVKIRANPLTLLVEVGGKEPF